MSKRNFILAILLAISACQSQHAVPLPTLATLPTLAPTHAPDSPPRSLPFWQAVDGILATSMQTDRWLFAAHAGDPIRLDTLGPVNLTLTAPDGSTLGSGATVETVLPADGTYTVLVQLAEGESGRYQLGLGYTDRPNPADYTATPPPVTIGVPTPTPVFANLGVFIANLENGSPQTETFLRGPVQPHVYTFDGRAGDYITVRMARLSGTVDPALWLYGPDGEALAVDHNSGDNRTALLRNIPLRQTGQYSVQADGGGGPGDYEISLMGDGRPVPVTPTIIVQPTITPALPAINLTPAAAVPDGVLEPYTPVIGSLSRPGAVNRHIIEVEQNNFVSISVRRPQPDSRLRPVVEIFDPAGAQIGAASGRSSNTGEALIQLLQIPETGAYSIFVRAEGSDTGEYIITYGQDTFYENVPRGPTLADTPYDSQIVRRGARDVWDVLLNAGDAITIAASPLNAALDPVIELYAPDGSLVASDDNSGGFPNALINQARAPISGLYRLYVSSSGGGTTGPYRLIWRYINLAPTPTSDPPRILLFTVEDGVAAGEYAFYPFQGTAGQRVRIHV